jgi:hypothetical protein
MDLQIPNYRLQITDSEFAIPNLKFVICDLIAGGLIRAHQWNPWFPY